MTSKAKQNCQLIIRRLIDAKNLNITGWKAVEYMIAEEIGADPRTLRKYKKWLRRFGYLYELDDGRVKMNLDLIQQELGDVQLRLEVQEK